MPTRRTLVFTALTALLACSDLSIAYAAPPPVNDPVGIVSEIYTRVTNQTYSGRPGPDQPALHQTAAITARA